MAVLERELSRTTELVLGNEHNYPEPRHPMTMLKGLVLVQVYIRSLFLMHLCRPLVDCLWW